MDELTITDIRMWMHLWEIPEEEFRHIKAFFKVSAEKLGESVELVAFEARTNGSVSTEMHRIWVEEARPALVEAGELA